ncbi:MAG: hypothetical protein ACT4QF_05065 [Sporichthyaceae bacterium]
MAMLTNPSAPLDALNRGRSRGSILSAGAAILVVLGVLIALAIRALPSDEAGQPSSPTEAPTVPAASAPEQPDTRPNPTDELKLPQPTGFANGVPTGYPQTDPGAVAAAYGYSRIATGLDVQQTLDTLKAISDPQAGWFPRARDEIADGIVAQRKGLGLAAVGSTGSALITVSPSGYQIVPGPAGATTVLTLNVVSTASADGTTATGTLVFRWTLRWDGERWLATRTFLDDADAALAVAPLTSEAVAKGWKAARGG